LVLKNKIKDLINEENINLLLNILTKKKKLKLSLEDIENINKIVVSKSKKIFSDETVNLPTRISHASDLLKKLINTNFARADIYIRQAFFFLKERKFSESYRMAKIYLAKQNFRKKPVCNNLSILRTLMIIFKYNGKYKEAYRFMKMALKISYEHFVVFSMAEIELRYPKKFNKGVIKYDIRFGNYEEASKPRYINNNKFLARYKIIYGKKIYIWAEQGIGDHLYFFSYVINLRNFKKNNFIVEVDNRLKRIFERYLYLIKVKNITLFGIDKLSSNLLAENEFDYHFPLGSIARISKKNNFLETKNNFYALADNTLVKQFSYLLSDKKKIKIGISWKSFTKKEFNRNIDLINMKKILKIKKLVFINLQFGNFIDDIDYIKKKINVDIKFFNIDYKKDIEKVCAIIKNLDLVITIQNTIAHLCGALGKKCFLLLPTGGRWMYGVTGSSINHYPSIRIFRQKNANDWGDCLEAIYNELHNKYL